jgi:hypothetical protein
MLDLGLKGSLSEILDHLSEETPEGLGRRLTEAEAEGLRPVPLRTIHEVVDFWRDDFWNWLG